MTRVIHILIRGKPSYEKWSIYQWIVENIDILEREYCVKISVSMIDGLESTPVIIIDNEVVYNIPFDEGYVIEILKKVLDRIINRDVV